MSDHCEGFCTSGAVICPLLVAPERFSGAYGLAQSYWFLCVFMGYPSETSMKCGRNSTTEKSGNCTTPLASCAVSSAPFPHNKSSLLWGAPPSLLTYSPVSSLLYSYACLARLTPRFFTVLASFPLRWLRLTVFQYPLSKKSPKYDSLTCLHEVVQCQSSPASQSVHYPRNSATRRDGGCCISWQKWRWVEEGVYLLRYILIGLSWP